MGGMSVSVVGATSAATASEANGMRDRVAKLLKSGTSLLGFSRCQGWRSGVSDAMLADTTVTLYRVGPGSPS